MIIPGPSLERQAVVDTNIPVLRISKPYKALEDPGPKSRKVNEGGIKKDKKSSQEKSGWKWLCPSPCPSGEDVSHKHRIAALGRHFKTLMLTKSVKGPGALPAPTSTPTSPKTRVKENLHQKAVLKLEFS